jgi:hypothetical protein
MSDELIPGWLAILETRWLMERRRPEVRFCLLRRHQSGGWLISRKTTAAARKGGDQKAVPANPLAGMLPVFRSQHPANAAGQPSRLAGLSASLPFSARIDREGWHPNNPRLVARYNGHLPLAYPLRLATTCHRSIFSCPVESLARHAVRVCTATLRPFDPFLFRHLEQALYY